MTFSAKFNKPAGFRFSLILSGLLSLTPSLASAREWYFTWGYSRDYWAPSDIHISQPNLGSDFTVHNVQAEDFPQKVFGNDITIPQFALRIGQFLNDEEDLALEFSLDHTKYTTRNDQVAHITGTRNGAPIDTNLELTPTTFSYRLHNGANHVMLSLVKRKPIIGGLNQNFSLSLLFKGGLGLMIPHAESTIFGQDSDVGGKGWGNLIGTNSGWWRLNGWTIGGEVGARMMTWRPVFIEIADKIAYASLTNVPVYQGKADQKLWMNEVLLNLGVSFGAKVSGL